MAVGTFMLKRFLVIFCLLLTGCVETAPVPSGNTVASALSAAPTTTQAVRQPGAAADKAEGLRILVIGDSMFASNRLAGASVADVIENELGAEVTDYATVGARYFLGIPLRPQYRAGDWDWVVMNGGGNDLLFGCGCGKCTGVLDRLVSGDGRSGIIPAFVAKIRSSGAKVVYSGYLRNPGVQTPIKSCGPAGNELDRRLTLMAGFDPGVTFLPMSDLVPQGDRSYHGIDLIHPSVKGSRGIGKRIAAVIAKGK